MRREGHRFNSTDSDTVAAATVSGMLVEAKLRATGGTTLLLLTKKYLEHELGIIRRTMTADQGQNQKQTDEYNIV